jgi:hypothetical protein
MMARGRDEVGGGEEDDDGRETHTDGLQLS